MIERVNINRYFPVLLLWMVTVNTFSGIPAHPRILMSEEDKKGIQQQIKTDSTWLGLHTDILSESDKMLSLPPLEREQIGMRLLAVSREALRRVFFLSYAYRMTEDEKYFKRAEKELLTVSRFKDWNPGHFLDVAEMTLGVAIGYDWLYNELSAESRVEILNAIIQKGINPSLDDKYNWWLEAKHNWNQVCNTGITFGALAVYEEDPSHFQAVIDRGIRSMRLPMKDYGPDGAYPEGYAYWEYGTTFNVLFLSALEKVFHSDFDLLAIDGFINTASYYEHMTGLSGESFNYADCGEEYGLTPAMFWFARKTKDPSLLWTEKKFMNKKHSNNYLLNRILPVAMIWGIDIPMNKITPPGELMWTGAGTTPVALMRTSWTDPNGIYIGFKGGTASSNHAHMDAGSFIMEADGVRWAIDFGKQDYESLESKKLQIWTNNQDSERWKVFRYNNHVHNTLTINDKLHNVNGHAPITSHSDNEDFLFACSDLSSIFDGELLSARRGVSIINKEYVMVRDELESLPGKPVKLRWTMLTSARVKIKGKNRIELQKDGKKLQLHITSRQPVQVKTWSTRSPNDYDAHNTGTILIGFESFIPPGKTADFTVILLPDHVKYKKRDIKPLDLWPTQ